MRRALPVAMLCGLLALCSAAVAQRGGAGHSGGHAGGFHAGISAPHSFSGASGNAHRGFGAAPRMAPRYGVVSRNNSAFRPAYRAGRQGPGGRYPHRPPYRGVYAYPYYNSWGFPLTFGYPDFAGYGNDAGPYQSSDQADAQTQYLAPPDTGYGQDYAPPPFRAAPAPVTSSAAMATEPQLTLIFQDGHTQTVRNYMMTASTIILLDQAASGRELRIPLSELNLPATERAAQQAGLDFSPPAT